MAAKNTTGKALRTEQKRSTPSISVRIDRLVDYDKSKLKAIVSVNIGGAFAIHGLRVIDSQKGLFVQMPQNSFQRDGKTEYSDIPSHHSRGSQRAEQQGAGSLRAGTH